jgi:hypothetical protein
VYTCQHLSVVVRRFFYRCHVKLFFWSPLVRLKVLIRPLELNSCRSLNSPDSGSNLRQKAGG